MLGILVREIAKPLFPTENVGFTVRMQMEMNKERPITFNRPCRNRETQPASYHIQSCQKDAQRSPPYSRQASESVATPQPVSLMSLSLIISLPILL